MVTKMGRNDVEKNIFMLVSLAFGNSGRHFLPGENIGG